MVVGERVGFAGFRVGDFDGVRGRVDRTGLGVDAHVEVERRFEGLRGVEEEPCGVDYLPADVVRESAVCEGDVWASLHNDDVCFFIAAT